MVENPEKKETLVLHLSEAAKCTVFWGWNRRWALIIFGFGEGWDVDNSYENRQEFDKQIRDEEEQVLAIDEDEDESLSELFIFLFFYFER